ncbi:MAG: hypothetical protein R3E91_03450 [Chlamydiales bacterium]
MGSFFPSAPIYFGIDLHKETVRLAKLKKKKAAWELMSLTTHQYSEDFISLLDEGTTISLLPSKGVLVRGSEIQVEKDKDIQAAIPFQLEPLLPYSIDQAIIRFQKIKKKSHATLLTHFSVRKDHLEEHLKALHTKNIVPQVVTCVPYALAALTRLFTESSAINFLVYEGEEETTCILVDQGKLLAARAFKKTQHLGNEVQKTVLSFASSHKTKKIDTIFLLGRHPEQIEAATGKMVKCPSLLASNVSNEDLREYGLAIGGAIAGYEINFIEEKRSYPYQWSRFKKPLITSITLLGILLGTLLSFAKISLNQEKKRIEESVVSLLQAEGKNILTEQLLDADDYLFTLEKIEKTINSRPNTYPMLPNIPNVSELLAWLAKQPSIAIDSIQYSMIKRPDFSRKDERYKVRVEIEFFSKSTETTDAFHNALLSAQNVIDPKEAVEWSNSKGKYKTSFYLKDKTQYNS